ncbi:isoquinoline 1-oxidoreductase subunit beta [Ferrovum sp. JA12]|uniref:xanthine dehydrogenase family protein molybdopterin-binding subunit n=1 Tax=Ferrovum sp. JA12 TaxID=1356299 RepID=UPI000702EDCD|nr:molybdopterin cofactor-binding domain-containing protein [Ferrovum sp. JA12]KRH78683.1 isoquinoline 1-oxidoreductase subunit beta [Ferrovum sp. JA12]
MALSISRRDFFKLVAVAGGGFAIGLNHDALADTQHNTFTPSPWVKIEPTGLITILVDKSEMGQGVNTALPMLLAEEMDADWQKIRVVFAPSDPIYAHPWFHTQATGGSTSVRAMWMPLRQAGAAAREILRQAAAKKWQVSVDSVHIKNGIAHSGFHRATFGDLANIASTLPAPSEVKLKTPEQFNFIGQSIPRVDNLAKSTGRARFGMDIQLPGMLIAGVIRAPHPGAKVVSFDADKALKIKGVHYVLKVSSPVSEGVAVLANNTWIAFEARKAVTVQWDKAVDSGFNSDALLEKMKRLVAGGEQTLTAVDRQQSTDNLTASNKITSTYYAPFLAHAPMEPLNCTAWVQHDQVEVWVGTQAQGPNQQMISQLTGMPTQQVHVYTQYLGGGFGRRFAPDFVMEAVVLSKQILTPVKVVYDRTDDLTQYYYRPAALCQLEGAIDHNGQITHLRAITATDSIAQGTGFEKALIKGGVDQTSVEGLHDIPYTIPNFKVEWANLNSGVRTWFWRSVGHSQNSFFSECFMDELAHLAQVDPLEFRLKHLANHSRHYAVLQLLQDKSNWHSTLESGHARGVAIVESFGSVVAQMVEISLVDNTPKLHRVVIAADVGTVVNPDTVKAQLEGAMVFGLSAALYGEVKFKDGHPQVNNFSDYPVVRLIEVPPVEVYLISTHDHPGGVGEPGTPPIAPALCNALFVLTQKRHYQLPIVVNA